MPEIIRINEGVTRNPEWRFKEPVNFVLNDNEHVAIIGNNSSGKSMLVDIITGRHPLLMSAPTYKFGDDANKPHVADNIKYITFKDSYGDNDNTYYLQQRWNQHDVDENTPTVNSLLEESYNLCGKDTIERRNFQRNLYRLLHVEHLLNKYIILLSSGELRKIHLIRTLLSEPKLLIIDNPFIGLDDSMREQLKDILSLLVKEKTLQIVLVLSKPDEIPEFITHVVEVNDMKVSSKVSLSKYLTKKVTIPDNLLSKETINNISRLPNKAIDNKSDEIVRMTNICIRYGNHVILKDFNWTIHKGEKWALSGKNGAGKSTLLSLICADNPQAYACDIALFGKKRGSGESIWDIKKHIGYISPEMHRAYKHNISALNVVASGLKDSIGLYMHPSKTDYDISKWWMKIFNVDNLCDHPFLKLSSGEQRLILLARTFVKDPELLILDEPFHGLDDRNRRMVTEIIEEFCKRPDKTLIIVSHYLNEFPKCITNKLILKRNT